jgi:hypothetical protein
MHMGLLSYVASTDIYHFFGYIPIVFYEWYARLTYAIFFPLY